MPLQLLTSPLLLRPPAPPRVVPPSAPTPPSHHHALPQLATQAERLLGKKRARGGAAATLPPGVKGVPAWSSPDVARRVRARALGLLRQLLIAKLGELESATGSADADARLLHGGAASGWSAWLGPSRGGAGASLDPALRACVIYRLGQKRLARAYLAEAEALLRDTP